MLFCASWRKLSLRYGTEAGSANLSVTKNPPKIKYAFSIIDNVLHLPCPACVQDGNRRGDKVGPENPGAADDS